MIDDLLGFLRDSPTPFHAVAEGQRRLDAAGFARLDETARWDQLAPGAYQVTTTGTNLFALRIPEQRTQFRIIGAHTDSPNLRLKANAEYAAEGYAQLGVEVYGGALLNSWLDRDLGLAGRVLVRAEGGGLESRLVSIARPVLRIPQLAIHLDRTVNEQGVKLNPQTQLAPIWGLAGSVSPDDAFADLLATAAGVPVDQLLTHDLSLFDLTPAAVGGATGDLLFAARLDNLASVHAGLTALLQQADAGRHDTVPVLACFDHEEVGSSSRDGAAGTLLATVLERLALSCGLAREAQLAALASSLMLSADMAHAVHPNYADRHEPRHKPKLGGGPVLKTNHNQRYATSAASAAQVQRLARSAGITLQDFVTRSDLGCGSTIGPAVAAGLGMAVADLGAPMLSMHSARECMAVADVAPYVQLLAAHVAT